VRIVDLEGSNEGCLGHGKDLDQGSKKNFAVDSDVRKGINKKTL